MDPRKLRLPPWLVMFAAPADGGGGEPGDDEDPDDGPDDDGEPGDDEVLGPKGTKALAAMKDRARKAEREARAFKALGLTPEQIQALADGSGKPDDGEGDADKIAAAVAKATKDAEREANTKAAQRVLRSEIRAQASATFEDPSDALAFLDLKDFDLDDDGEPDADQIKEALEDLLARKPRLGKVTAQGGTGGSGSADGGSRNGDRPKQLTREDLKGMSPQAITKAKAEGRLDRLLGR